MVAKGTTKPQKRGGVGVLLGSVFGVKGYILAIRLLKTAAVRVGLGSGTGRKGVKDFREYTVLVWHEYRADWLRLSGRQCAIAPVLSPFSVQGARLHRCEE